MKRIVSAVLLLMMLLSFTACDKAETPTQEPIVTDTSTQETTKVPTTTPTIKITPEPTESHPLKEIIIDTSDEYFGWVHEEGAGNPAHLAEAVRRIELYVPESPYDVEYWPEDPSKEQRRTVREVITENLKNILWDLDVYVSGISVGGRPIGDKWDENGNWVPVELPSKDISATITLVAGDKETDARVSLK